MSKTMKTPDSLKSYFNGEPIPVCQDPLSIIVPESTEGQTVLYRGVPGTVKIATCYHIKELRETKGGKNGRKLKVPIPPSGEREKKLKIVFAPGQKYFPNRLVDFNDPDLVYQSNGMGPLGIEPRF